MTVSSVRPKEPWGSIQQQFRFIIFQRIAQFVPISGTMDLCPPHNLSPKFRTISFFSRTLLEQFVRKREPVVSINYAGIERDPLYVIITP